MADVDLYGGEAQRIRDQYRTSLGRDASNDEVSGWLSGQYGGGGTNDWLQQIQGSGEAQSYRPPTQTLTPDPTLNHAWDTPAPQATQQPQGFDQISQWYQQYLGRDPGQDDISKWLSGAYGWGNSGNLAGIERGIQGSGEARAYGGPQLVGNNPNVSGPQTESPYQNTDWWSAQGVPQSDMFDLTTGQLKPGWSRTAKGYERTGGSNTSSGDVQSWLMPMLTGASSPNALAALEPELNKRGIKLQKDSDGNIRGRLYLPDGSTVDVVSQWGQPWTWINRGAGGGGGGASGGPGSQYSDPYTKFLEELMGGRLQGLLQPVNDPNRQMYEQMLKQRADTLGRLSPELDKQISYLESRFKDLQGNGYTGAEGEAIRTGALDPIETDRQAARKRVMERLSARGLTPDSGIAQQALLEVDKAFDAMRGTTQTALTTNDLNRREDRKQRAETIRGTLSQIPEGRAREQLDVFGALNSLSQLARQEDESRQREAVGYGGALADLGPQRLQLAMQAAGMGGQPSSMFQNLMQLAGLNQNSAMYGANNQSQLWSGLGSIAAMLANSGR